MICAENKTYLIVWILLFSLTNAVSQSASQLDSLKQNYKTAAKARSELARTFAIENAVPLSQNTSEGKHLLLVDVKDGVPVYLSGLNSDAAATTGASKIQGGINGLNIEGEGMLIGVWDEGSAVDHIELGGRVVTKEVNNHQTHASHVTGTIIAAGINPLAKGMAPKGKVTNWYFDNDLAEMAALTKPDENSLLLSNHSYGTVTGWVKINGNWFWTGNTTISNDEDYRFGFYGAKAAELDRLANLAPYYTIVWAAGNDRGEPGDGSRPPDCNGGTGYDCIIPESVAKNILTVGAVNKTTTYTGPSSVAMSSFSSWGPTDDGRIKPDVVGAGVNLFSLSASGVNAYGFLSGTSMATPNVTGSLALLQDLYRQLHGGSAMRSSTLKALAIHTAKEAGPLPGPDYSFGWGLVDVEGAAKLLVSEDGTSTVIREESLLDGTTFEITLLPKANQKITATIAWNDPAAEPTTPALDPIKLMLVNDLDIKLVAEGGTTNYPWLLDPSTPSAQAIKGDNYRDNVEKLEFNLPAVKPYKLVVSHKGKLVNDSQDFSLILTYQPAQQGGNTLYWVGDSGNWGDNTHWSLSSGGPSALLVPGPNDRIIVDENSFDGVGVDEIRLIQNQSCRSLKWLRKKEAKLNLQGISLTINRELVIGNGLFGTAGSGSIRCATAATSKGNLSFSNANLGQVQLLVDGGEWTLKGNLQIDDLEVKQGELSVTKSLLKLKKLTANSLASKKVRLNMSVIEIANQSDINGEQLQLETVESSIYLKGETVILNWNDVSLAGTLKIEGSTVSINGSNAIDTLDILPGSAVILAPSTNLTVKSIVHLAGLPDNTVTISSTTKASLTPITHFLLCADYLNVTNVDLIGSARINVGVSGTLSNAANWLSQPCESVLFADFDEKYLCQNGFTEFTDKSLNATTWKWLFGNEESAINSSNLQHPFHEFIKAGPSNVRLEVSDGQSIHAYTKQIEIASSVVEKNKIAINSNELMSLSTAASYQWFLNEQMINGANARSYSHAGKDGVYRVVIELGNDCNLSSDLATITGVEEKVGLTEIYPNPVRDFLSIRNNDLSPAKVSLTDLQGRLLIEAELSAELLLPVSNLSSGIYVLRIRKQDRQIVRRIVVEN